MNISYDIFDLADFPIVLTDENFIITYKNRLAAKFFRKFRKRSKIIKHFRNFKNDMDFSNINELDIETGTQFMRALVFPIDEKSFLFLFFTIYAFADTKKILEHIRENFAGNLLDFYCTAYREHERLEKMSAFEKANVSERAYSELMYLLSSYSEKPAFMQADVYDIAEITAQISTKAAFSLAPFGLSIASDESVREPCFSKINLRYFTFIIFRMIYTVFKLSRTGRIQVSIDNSRYPLADVCIYTETSVPSELADTKDFSSLINLLPEFSFEFSLLKKIGLFNNSLFFSLKNSILELHYQVKCENGFDLVLRSEPQELRKKRTDKIISEMLYKIKLLLSKK